MEVALDDVKRWIRISMLEVARKTLPLRYEIREGGFLSSDRKMGKVILI
ncbi:MAG: hypothetical protein ACP5K1_07550 [Candidatus Bathyarchaeia archaeon]